MDEYKYLRPKAFETPDKFEKRLNEVCNQGWKPIAIGGMQGNIVLLQKIEKYNY